MTTAELKPITLEALRSLDAAGEKWTAQGDVEAAVSKALVESGSIPAGMRLLPGALRPALKELRAAGLVKFHSTIQFNGRTCTGADYWRPVPLNQQTAPAV